METTVRVSLIALIGVPLPAFLQLTLPPAGVSIVGCNGATRLRSHHLQARDVNTGALVHDYIDAATGNSQALPCGVPAVAFQRLMTSAISIGGQNSGSVWITDTDAAAPWVAFAPSLR